MPKMIRNEKYIKITVNALCVLSVLALCGCGIKPSSVEPPPGKESSSFPNQYPAPEPIE